MALVEQKKQELMKRVASIGGGKPSVAIKPAGKRVFTGEPVETTTKLSKLQVGALGERIAIAHLKAQGLEDAAPLNMKTTNFPVDLVGDHQVIEVKTGLVSNGKSAQQWRATIGQPGKAETEWLKTASRDAKAAWNEKKAAAIMARKQAAVEAFSKELGHKVTGKTMTLIINPDTKTADIHVFEGFHARIAWGSDQAKDGYVGTVSYDDGDD